MNRDFSQVAVVVDVVVDRYALALPTVNAVAWLAEIPGSARTWPGLSSPKPAST